MLIFKSLFFNQALKWVGLCKIAACLARCLPPPNSFSFPAKAGFSCPHYTSTKSLESEQYHSIYGRGCGRSHRKGHQECFTALCDVTVGWFPKMKLVEEGWVFLTSGELSGRPETYYCKHYGKSMCIVWDIKCVKECISGVTNLVEPDSYFTTGSNEEQPVCYTLLE